MLNVMDAVRAEIVREGGQQRWARYSTRGATVPRGYCSQDAAARARERWLGLGALGTRAAGLRPRPAREKGFPSNLLLD